MKKFLLLVLLLGLPSPLFASNESTDGYKETTHCYYPDGKKKNRTNRYSLWKKEHTNSKKWGFYSCAYEYRDPPYQSYPYDCIWGGKGVSYDEANGDYESACETGNV